MRKFLVFWSVFMLLVSVGVKGQTLFGGEQILVEQSVDQVTFLNVDNDHYKDVIIFHDNPINQTIVYYNDGNGNYIAYDTTSTIFPYLIDENSNGEVFKLSSYAGGNYWCEYEEETSSTNCHELPPGLLGDLDSDGDLDIFFVSSFSSPDRVYWHRNNGNGDFGEPETAFYVTEDADVYWLLSTDIDNDGDLDMVVSSRDKYELVWYENYGNGEFGTERNFIAPYRARRIFGVDVDSDGDKDIITNGNSWFENMGGGEMDENPKTFYSSSVTCAGTLSSVYDVDFDQDGDIDLLFEGFNEYVVFLENKGSGDYSNSTFSCDENGGLAQVFPVDIDMDGAIDIAYVVDETLFWRRNLINDHPIKAIAFYDENENGIYDENERGLKNQQLLLNPLNFEVFADEEGYSCYFTKTGLYQLTYKENTLWELTTSSESYEVLVTEDTGLPLYRFGFKPTRILPRVEPHLSSSPTRCNREATYWLNYTNTGTTIANGTITLETDELIEFVSSNPEPDLIEGQKLIWNISDLHPSFENKIQLQFQMPDFNSIGEILETQASIELFNENEELVYSKSTEYDSEVRCSYDPNDKQVRSSVLGQSDFAEMEDTLLYTIRFQNTGNDVAFNVRIEDQLHSNLDFNSFQPITASHDYYTKFNRQTRLINFHFDDIMLPDSTSNEPESHGFVMFQIALKKDLPKDAKTENTAYIYFDFNPPIITNTVVTEFFQEQTFETTYEVNAYPNPFEEFTEIIVENSINIRENYQLELINIWGRRVQTLDFPERAKKVRLERGELESGVYLYRILTDSSKIVGSGKVLVE